MWSFIKICLICIIGKNQLKEKFHRKNLSSFWLKLKQQWTIEEISIFSNSSHLEGRAELSDTILKGTHPGTIPARLGLIWFSGFRGEDLNVKVYDVRRTGAKWWQKLARWAKKFKFPIKCFNGWYFNQMQLTIHQVHLWASPI
jgi:hypothetical protein